MFELVFAHLGGPKEKRRFGKTEIMLTIEKLTKKTIDNKYLIPNITDTLDKLGRCNYFTTLDLVFTKSNFTPTT